MRRILARTRTEAPFLFGERGSLAITRSLKQIGGKGTTFGDGPRHDGLTLRGEHGPTLDGAVLSDIDGDGASLTLSGAGASWTRCSLRGATLKGGLPESTWEVVDLTGATVGAPMPASSFSLVSFRDAALSGQLSGSTFVLCDFSGARLDDLDLSGCRFVGCDFEDAWLSKVDLTGADLRGCTLKGAALVDCATEGADLDGARVGGGWLHGAWAKVLMKEPSAAAHRRTRRAVGLTWAFLAIALPVLFFLRAALDPVEPDYGPDLQAQEAEADE